MQDGIGHHHRVSRRFQALIRSSAWNLGYMWGWFHLVSGSSAETNPPTCRTFQKKRLMGFEPTTFCMAIRPISETGGRRT